MSNHSNSTTSLEDNEICLESIQSVEKCMKMKQQTLTQMTNIFPSNQHSDESDEDRMSEILLSQQQDQEELDDDHDETRERKNLIGTTINLLENVEKEATVLDQDVTLKVSMVSPPGKEIYLLAGVDSQKRVAVKNPKYRVNKTHKERWIDGEMGRSRTWYYSDCLNPSNDPYRNTVILVQGCYDFYFTSIQYRNHEHMVLMGKLNMWKEQTMTLIERFEISGQWDVSCFEKQKEFARNLVPKLLAEIESFSYCSIAILKKEILYKMFASCEDVHSTELLYEMASCKKFDIIACEEKDRLKFDVITRFDFDMKQGWAFGKPDKDTVAEYIESQKEKEYEFAAKRLKLEED